MISFFLLAQKSSRSLFLFFPFYYVIIMLPSVKTWYLRKHKLSSCGITWKLHCRNSYVFLKTLSYALRYGPEDFGLRLTEDGSVSIEELLKEISEKKHHTYTEEDLKKVFELPEKKRFVIENGRIRANYGHSTKKEVVSPEIEPPKILYHATSSKALSIILKEGLSSMIHQHVHLASTKETALEAGKRRDPDPPLLLIRAHEARENGEKFFQGNDDIYLSDSIPPIYTELCIGI